MKLPAFFLFAALAGKLCAFDPDRHWPGEVRIIEQSWGDSAEGLRLALGIEKEIYRPGEAILATGLLSNESEIPRFLSLYSDANLDFAFSVLDQYRRPVPEIQLNRAYDSRQSMLQARSRVARPVSISSQFNFSQPGFYSVSISKEIPSTNGTGNIRLTSGTAVIKVLSVDQTTSENEPTNALPVAQPTNAPAQQAANLRGQSPTQQISAPALPSKSSVNSTAPPPATDGVLQPEANRRTAAQKIGGTILAALLALTLAFVWRASRRKKD